jgi:hypothetical protein
MVGSNLASNHLTRLERLARDNHYSLFGLIDSYKGKKFVTITPGPNVIKLFTLVIYDVSF